MWNKAEAALEDALNASGREWVLNPADGAFYGPKIDITGRCGGGCRPAVWQWHMSLFREAAFGLLSSIARHWQTCLLRHLHLQPGVQSSQPSLGQRPLV
jgi:hypothetical protein